MAMHLIAPDPSKSTSWSIGEPDLGNHSFPLGVLGLQLSAGQIDLAWDGGAPPFRVESSAGLGEWENLTGLLESRSQVVTRMPSESRRFFRVVDGASLEGSADYRITFSSLWNEDRFATVPESAHFSGLVGGLHNESASFWSPGGLATQGIENMAETGSKTALLEEVQAAINAGTANLQLSWNGLGFAPAQTTLDFTAQRSHPLITITSMIAPSPDWFVGLHGQSLLKGNDDWVDALSFDLVAYDAGTEEGTTFSLSNPASTPAEGVFLIMSDDPEFAAFAPSFGPAGDPIPIARIVIERLRGAR
jgi:hypothetical protein